MGTKPYNEEELQVEQVRRMFNNIAHRYDFLNQLMSFGEFHKWRRGLVDILSTFSPKKVLDLATGTADLAIDIVRYVPTVESVIGVDISEEMMRIGQEKVKSLGVDHKITFQREDATKLPFNDNTFDAVTISFGLRNFDDIPASVNETFRVLRSGGVFIFIELTEPKNKILYSLYKIYSKTIMPLMGKLLSGDKTAYTYLPKSMASAPSREKLIAILNNAGFEDTFFRSFRFGTCTLYMGMKP